MKREEAIKTLQELWRETNDSWYDEAMNMAIEALSLANLKEEFESADAVHTCNTCADKALCIMSAPDGNWRACKDYKQADCVAVVRCKDCINYETCNLRLSHWWKGGYTVDIEFCSFGERREP